MRLGKGVRDTISWFTFSLIAGHLGPDDSRYSRDQLFLKHPGIASQAMAVFLYHIEVDDEGNVGNFEGAEERVREYILWKDSGMLPEVAFSDDELGISRR